MVREIEADAGRASPVRGPLPTPAWGRGLLAFHKSRLGSVKVRLI